MYRWAPSFRPKTAHAADRHQPRRRAAVLSRDEFTDSRVPVKLLLPFWMSAYGAIVDKDRAREPDKRTNIAIAQWMHSNSEERELSGSM